MRERRSKRLHRLPGLPGLAAIIALGSPLAIADLPSYVKEPDESFQWKIHRSVSVPEGGEARIVDLTSQTWRGIPWRHTLVVIRPARVAHPGHALLLISGGSNRDGLPDRLPGEARIVERIARETGSVVAVVSQVPNQPLFDGLYEDALIAHTFESFLKTGEESWPCLLPMTKSAVRAMDAVQAIARKEFDQDIGRFVVTGASKRGWTTWLTGAVDSRVAAIAPMVIDVLNMREQMPHQVRSFGGYSEKIHDYSDRDLPSRLADPKSDRLLQLVDPFSYRERLTMPKLILLGTNDRYWPVDAVKLYFGDLKGEKHIHYVPNKGHGLGPEAVYAISAFYDTILRGESLPRFRWSLARTEDEATLRVEARDAPVKVELWRASSSSRDFRDSRWSPGPAEKDGEGRFAATLPLPRRGFAAVFAQLTYRSDLGFEYTLSTNVEVLNRSEAEAGEGS